MSYSNKKTQLITTENMTLGCTFKKGYLYFAYPFSDEDCGVMLYGNISENEMTPQKIPFSPKNRMGNVFFASVKCTQPEKISYCFYEKDRLIADKYGRCFEHLEEYGKERYEDELRAKLNLGSFDWGKTTNPKIPYSQSLVYCLHVRGFTADASSAVEGKGTFHGLYGKIPYLKNLGVTTLEFQPVYEFTEMEKIKETNLLYQRKEETKLNYWGYKKGFYYAPKASYAYSEDAVSECKEMIKALHANNMEAIFQFYFVKGTSTREICDILRFWVLEYRVDGFHLMGEDIDIVELAKDPFLSETKLWYKNIPADEIYTKDETPVYENLACYEENYLYDMRKYLKGDDDMLGTVIYQMRHIPGKTGRIHYFSNYNTFTMMDMLSYDRKHNEDNGEENRDGNDHNCSWNCGEEGPSRKKKILRLRMQLYKNALIQLFFTSSTPLIFMGDEFGNSQQGNNNPYCQDNAVTRLNWKELEKNKEIYEFFLKLSKLRKEHPILRPASEYKVMDYISCGYPDLSYHGQNAWRPQMDCYSRQIGLLYCGKYVKKDRKNDDDFFYLAMNMHWEKHELALPRLPKGYQWEELILTGEEVVNLREKTLKEAEADTTEVREEIADSSCEEQVKQIAPRSIVVLISKKIQKKKM